MPPLHRGAVLTLAGALLIGLLAPAVTNHAETAVRAAATSASPVRESADATAAPPSDAGRPVSAAQARVNPAPLLRTGLAELAGPARAALVADSTVRTAAVKAVAAAPAPRCNTKQRPARTARYHGPSASKVYDQVFRPGPRVPHLAGWVPQGLTTWSNWNGHGDALLLLGMYRDGAQSYLVGINPTTGRHVGTVRTRATHFGALGISRGWLVAQDNVSARQAPAMRRYKVSSLRTQMLHAKKTGAKPYLAPHGRPQRVHGASFMTVHGGSVYVGRHVTRKPDSLYRYTVQPSGRLKAVDGPWRVPARTQGVLVSGRNFVFTTSAGGNRGKMVVVRRSAPSKSVACLWTPSLPQTMTTVGDRVYTAYESGAGKFSRSPSRNRIGELHTGRLAALREFLR